MVRIRIARVERYCSNCRAELPPKASACPACGVYAGDVFDGKWPGRPRKVLRYVVLVMLLLAAAGAWYVLRDRDLSPLLPQREEPKSAKKLAPPPAAGPVRSDAEAVRAVRRYLVATTGVENDCIALISNGRKGTAWLLTAVNRCDKLRLGKWRVDAKSGVVSRR